MSLKKLFTAALLGTGLLVTGSHAFAHDYDRDDRWRDRERYERRREREEEHRRHEWMEHHRDRYRHGYGYGYYNNSPYYNNGYYSDPYYYNSAPRPGISGYFYYSSPRR
jgi:hypothetical protein